MNITAQIIIIDGSTINIAADSFETKGGFIIFTKHEHNNPGISSSYAIFPAWRIAEIRVKDLG